MSKNKKIIVAVSAVAIILILAIVGYKIFSSDKEGPVTPANENPFGNGSGVNASGEVRQFSATQNDSDSPVGTILEKTPNLWKVSSNPVSGAMILDNGSTTLIRFIEKSTGNMYEVNTLSKSVSRLTNSTITKIDEVVWGNTGNFLVARRVENGAIESLYGTVSVSAASSSDGFAKLSTTNLLPNISNFVFSPNYSSTFYTVETDSGISAFIAGKSAGNPVSVWRFATREWIASWPNENTVALNTKPGFGIQGHLFFLDTKNFSFNKVLSRLALTSTVSSDTNQILYSESKEGGFALRLLNTKDSTDLEILPYTLSDKCTWGKTNTFYCGSPKIVPSGEYPDVWYQGLVSFSDNIWFYNTQTGETSLLSDLSLESGEEIDASNLQTNVRETLLIFTNKKDYSLWALKLTDN
jgi:hypothetical protein